MLTGFIYEYFIFLDNLYHTINSHMINLFGATVGIMDLLLGFVGFAIIIGVLWKGARS